MAHFLKHGRDADDIATEDAKVRSTVESILADIAARGDAAVRELSAKFDGWDREDFRLTNQRDRRDAMSELSARNLDDIQLRAGPGAHLRRAAEGRVWWTSRWRRCRASCWATRTSRSTPSAATCRAANTRCSPPPTCRVITAKVAGVPRIIDLRPAVPGQARTGDRGGPAPRPAPTRSTASAASRRSARWRIGTETHRAGRHAGRPRQCLSSRRPSGSCSAASASTCSPARPRRW